MTTPDLVETIRAALVTCGQSDAAISRSTGIAASQVGRFRRGMDGQISLAAAGRLVGCLGLSLSAFDSRTDEQTRQVPGQES